jgi:hypothetical protein
LPFNFAIHAPQKATYESSFSQKTEKELAADSSGTNPRFMGAAA